MESRQSPLIATFLTGAGTSQRLHWPRLHFWSLMFGLVALARAEPESSRVTCKVWGEWNQPWATCNQVFFVKNKITLRSMQLYLVPPSYGRSGAQGWYSTGWKIKLLFSLLFLLSTYLIGVPIFPNTLNLAVVICNEDLFSSKWQWCRCKTVLLATLTPFWNTF